MAGADSAPDCRDTSRPALNNTSVGMARMPKREPTSGSSSVFTLATSQRPRPSAATFTSSGATTYRDHTTAPKNPRARAGRTER